MQVRVSCESGIFQTKEKIKSNKSRLDNRASGDDRISGNPMNCQAPYKAGYEYMNYVFNPIYTALFRLLCTASGHLPGKGNYEDAERI